MARQTFIFVNHQFQHNEQRGRSRRLSAAERFVRRISSDRLALKSRVTEHIKSHQLMCLFLHDENEPTIE